jgi:GTP 3',8-cyclase
MQLLADQHGRSFPYLRLSLTEACNYRCSYCLPDGWRADGRQRFLGVDEIRRLVSAVAGLGMWKIRLTGGEPSLRKDLSEIIATVAGTPGVRKVALTTNGCLLPRHLARWRAAGLTALNVSLDSLDPHRFHAITGHDRHEELLSGVEQALAMDFDSVKLNAVLLRGVNDDELPRWLDWLRHRPMTLRFIELMRTGDNVEYFRRHHLAAASVEARLLARGWRLVPREADAGPAREFAHPLHAGRVGLIAPYSKDFCAGCNRLRVTARGDLRLCLFGDFGIPLRALLHADDQRDELMRRIRNMLGQKAAGHLLHEGKTGITPHLASLGG